MEFSDYDTRLAAYAVIVDQEHVLLPLWNEVQPGEWTLPGGGADLDESVEETAVREVAEETGYTIELTRLLGVDSFVVPPHERLSGPTDRALKNVRVIYEGRIVGGTLSDEVDGTTDEARWIPLDQVAQVRRVPLVDVALDLWRSAQPQR